MDQGDGNVCVGCAVGVDVGVPPPADGGVAVSENGGGVAVLPGLGTVAVGNAVAVGALVGRAGGLVAGASVGCGVGGCGVRMMTDGKVGVGNKMGGRVGKPGGRVAVTVGVTEALGWAAMMPTGGNKSCAPASRAGPVRQFTAISSSGKMPRARARASIVSPCSTR